MVLTFIDSTITHVSCSIACNRVYTALELPPKGCKLLVVGSDSDQLATAKFELEDRSYTIVGEVVITNTVTEELKRLYDVYMFVVYHVLNRSIDSYFSTVVLYGHFIEHDPFRAELWEKSANSKALFTPSPVLAETIDCIEKELTQIGVSKPFRAVDLACGSGMRIESIIVIKHHND